MSNTGLPYRIFSLGDSACTVDWGPAISPEINRLVMARLAELRRHSLPGIVEISPAYSSLTVYYDPLLLRRQTEPGQTAAEKIGTWLEERLREPVEPAATQPRLIRIPVCYEAGFAPDLGALAAEKKITSEALIGLHTATEYQVYMLGFLPGFAYMGEVVEGLASSRKPQPIPVKAGSVGIAGRQTGIYPLDSPGGWQIIGRTPLSLFDPHREEPCLLRAGDRVRFYRIGEAEFYNGNT